MTKQRKAQALTAALMAGIGLFVVVRQRPDVGAAIPGAPSRKPDPTPQDAIYAMFDAARDGNVNVYLGCFTGDMERALRQSASEQGEEAFAKYLKEANAPVKGIAITEPQAVRDGEVKAKVEYVYRDRNETQVYYLERMGNDWKISRLDTAERIKTLVPYGSPVQ